MGCGGYSKITKPDANGAVNRKITKDQVHVDLGNKVKVNENGSTIIFVYGGPGSKKGRLVSELAEVFDFTFINVEKLMLQKLAEHRQEVDQKDQGDRKESVQELKKMLEDDPSTISLSWILREVTAVVDTNPKGRYLVDMMPNLKYIIRTANFSQDCSSNMAVFEKKYPVSFSLYFSMISNGKTKGAKKVEVVKEEKEEEKPGFQTDEVDLSRTKRRALMFENSVKSFLDYFEKSDRLMLVDASCKNADVISSKVCEVFSQLGLRNQKLVNTVLIFIFDSKVVDFELLQEHDVEYIRLEEPGTKLSVATLDEAIKSFVSTLNHKEHKTFVIDLSATEITKNTPVQVEKTSIVFVNEASLDHYFDLPGCTGMFKTVSSLENAVCIFPADTEQSLCKKIAIAFNNEFSVSRDIGEGHEHS
ncbi:hypothetical protein Bpfe_015868 [Biomphalaria pfeifferi]|uniref:Uncharacterized protein n=1 Tax=Biomphalaria pfeifferi TaxID=112525 RepID=A0AAD8F8Y8_BIOPF|nr:hypothetical protein Bpfe_015868 [Biomphalaria pfeifferi]